MREYFIPILLCQHGDYIILMDNVENCEVKMEREVFVDIKEINKPTFCMNCEGKLDYIQFRTPIKTLNGYWCPQCVDDFLIMR